MAVHSAVRREPDFDRADVVVFALAIALPFVGVRGRGG